MRFSNYLLEFDNYLLNPPTQPALRGYALLLAEIGFFSLKQARACLFALLFFTGVFLIPQAGLFGVPRYDVFLIIALGIQTWMVATRLETREELLAITIFHLVGFALEVFKTSSGIKSWAYPDVAYTKLLGVPLFSGFMYAAVGSYLIQAWRFFDVRVKHHPPYWMAVLVALAIYANFFTHHYLGDYRWYIAACILGLYAQTRLSYRAWHHSRTLPLLWVFVLMGFALWLAENISTFFGVWKYPHQLTTWSAVHLGKWSSWSLLIIMTFTIVAQLKHIRQHIHVPQ
jgi:uncharacterized membrane protein YoaT (DUF817 family)